jgi:hypothetical protein
MPDSTISAELNAELIEKLADALEKLDEIRDLVHGLEGRVAKLEEQQGGTTT